jgi:hypothetical protein
MGFPLLDSTLRNYIFIPLTIITMCVSLLMKYLNTLFNKDQKEVNPFDRNSLEEFSLEYQLKSKDTNLVAQNSVDRANNLKENFMYISEKGFKKRQAFFNEYFSQELQSNKSFELFSSNFLGDLVKRNLSTLVYYISIYLFGDFFDGYLLIKLPFGLTRKFKSMMQQGLNLPDFDPSYVSAISWCLILIFGINPILQFFDGGEEYSMIDEQSQMMNQPLNTVTKVISGDIKEVFEAEKESINIISNFSLVEEAVDTLINTYEE